MSVLAGLLVLLCLREPPRRASPRLQQAPAAPEQTKDGGEFGDGLWVSVAMIVVASSCYNFGQSFFDGFLPLLCAEHFGLKPALIGSTQTGLAVVVLVVSL